MAVQLSPTERQQLGSVRLLRNGEAASHPYPSADQWPAIRRLLVERSGKSNPNLNPRLCAYTPGETVGLLAEPQIRAWHERVAKTQISDQYTQLVLVPCAKTKPWVGPAVKKSKLYSAYNELRAQYPDACFITISEPLGIVPMQDWADFPQYDNPGLFRDDAQQSGMTKKIWEASQFGQWYGLPFDEAAYELCINQLGSVIAEFLGRHQHMRIVSAVDEMRGPRSTHGAMLDVAEILNPELEIERYPKRIEARVSPLGYLAQVLQAKAQEHQLNRKPVLSEMLVPDAGRLASAIDHISMR